MTPLPEFAALAAAGRYRDALLHLETAWFDDRSEFYAALLQVMVACNQIAMGMRPERTLRRAAERLAPYAPAHQGLDVAALLGWLHAARAALPAGEPVPLPPPLRGDW